MLFKWKTFMFSGFTWKTNFSPRNGGGGGGGGGVGGWCPVAPSFSKALHNGDTGGTLAFHKNWIGESLFSFLSVLFNLIEL